MKIFKGQDDPFSFSQEKQKLLNAKLALLIIKNLYKDKKITKDEYERVVLNSRCRNVDKI